MHCSRRMVACSEGGGKPSLVAIAGTAGADAFGVRIAISLSLEFVALSDVGSYAVSLIIAQSFLHMSGFGRGANTEDR